MGMEICIGAKILRKADHTPITVGCPKEEWEYTDNWGHEYFMVCYWRKDYGMLHFLFELAERYGIESGEKNFCGTFSLPEKAIREIYEKAIAFSCIPALEDENDFETETRYITENQNVRNAHFLSDVLTAIKSGLYWESKPVPKGCFCEGVGLHELQNHPDDFEWEFSVTWG